MATSSVATVAVVSDLSELLCRYARAVDGLAFDDLDGVLAPAVSVRYAWLPLGAARHESVDLAGLDAVRAWLTASLAGRPDLRRYLSGFELLDWSHGSATLTAAMHERDMRITGRYRITASRAASGWLVDSLDLVEEIHWVASRGPSAPD